MVFVLGRASIAESAETIAAAAAMLHAALSGAQVPCRRCGVRTCTGRSTWGLHREFFPGVSASPMGAKLLAPHWEGSPERGGRDTTEILRSRGRRAS